MLPVKFRSFQLVFSWGKWRGPAANLCSRRTFGYCQITEVPSLQAGMEWAGHAINGSHVQPSYTLQAHKSPPGDWWNAISRSDRYGEMNATVICGRTKALCNIKFFSAYSSAIPHKSNLASYYFSLLHSSPDLTHLRHLHARLLRTPLYADVFLSSKLVLMYSRRSKLFPDSLSVFYHMPERNIYSWNIIIGEFSRSSFPEKAIELFIRMQGSGIRPDDFTMPLVLRACAGSGSEIGGLLVHGLCVKTGMEGNLFVASALVFMYVTFGRVFSARVVFDGMRKRDAVLWTAMLAGYAQHEEPMLGLGVFREMVNDGVELDGVVMVSLLLVCGHLGSLKHGKSVHGWSLRRCLALELNLGNAIVDMYVKCASLCYAHRMFDKMPERDVISWSSMIVGYGLGGGAATAIEYFEKMLVGGVKPNDVTFLGVLSAYTHSGMVDRVRSCFGMMKDYGVEPELKHYACVVDCLGRAGLLEEAERFVEEMPIQPDGAILGALLGGCRLHANVEVGERVAKKLIGLEPEKAGYYVLLCDIYAAVGRFNDAERVRSFMQQRNVSKSPGCSLIESKTCFPLQNEVSFGFEVG
ncbi:pentatricopeptide repeat-containing protein At4g14170 [Malania oleifera]|uniref:pentatricopeptide repeat-containing protein At4g14170 n=1 Tax=Malania oleifera TaxID=397392 RepID=UPI0025AE6BB4|nr:pentatricopeptide repeat-containing protein At4g14170 [Malania oleifera]